MPQPTNATNQLDLHTTLHNAVYDVKMFGALGDGVANDATAIQAAITAAATGGGIVLIPPGTYKLTTGLTLARGITLQGAGTNATFLKDNAGASAVITLSGAGLSPSDVAIRDLTLLGGTGTGDGIQLNGTSGAIITNVRIENIFLDGLDGSYGIKATWAIGTKVLRCKTRSQAGTGIAFIDSANASTVRDCDLSNSGAGSTAISLTGTGTSQVGMTIEDCVIEAWRGSYGVFIDTVGPVRIRGCHFEDNRGVDLFTQGSYCHDLLVDSCHFSPDGSQTYVADVTALNAVFLNNDFNTKPVHVRTAGGGNGTYYTFIGNRFVGMAGTLVQDDTTVGQDLVTYVGNSPIPHILSPYIRVYENQTGLWMTEAPGDPSAPAANAVQIYAKDNGAGKTGLYARFNTGAVQQIALQP